MIKKILTLVAAVTLVWGMSTNALADNGGGFRDVRGHWAEKSIAAAQLAGWVNGYPNGTFKPDNPITRAEFVKMLLAATHLTPGSAAVSDLISSTADYLNTQSLNFQNSWFETQGWAKAAQALGIIITSDYFDGAFLPNQPITRNEIAVMADRALGLVYPTSKADPTALTFVDAAQIPAWAKGYVLTAKEAGIMLGFTDGTFGGSRTATRAEAVTVVLRVLNHMESGIDKEIKVILQAYNTDKTLPVVLSVPAQMVGGRIYISGLDFFSAATQLYSSAGSSSSSTIKHYWDPVTQTKTYYYGTYLWAQAGNTRVSFEYGGTSSLPAPARLLYGNLMIPIDDPASPAFPASRVSWDSGTKTLVVIPFPAPSPRSS